MTDKIKTPTVGVGEKCVEFVAAGSILLPLQFFVKRGGAS
jgi:hypothetical protein